MRFFIEIFMSRGRSLENEIDMFIYFVYVKRRVNVECNVCIELIYYID